MKIKKIDDFTNKPSPIRVYHGTKNPIDKFNLNFVGNGHDTEGVGIYFTSTIKDALLQSGGNYVIEADILISKSVSLTKSAKLSEIKKLIESSPSLNDVLSDYDENLTIAKNKAIKMIIDYNENAHKQFQSIWYDFYRYYSKTFVENIAKLGYDGVIIEREDNITHYVMYNVNNIKIIKTEYYAPQ